MGSLPPAAKPIWPPPDGAYGYIQNLNSTELAWEFLRRNPDYQRAFAAASGRPVPQRLPSGHLYWPADENSPEETHWDLWSFR